MILTVMLTHASDKPSNQSNQLKVLNDSISQKSKVFCVLTGIVLIKTDTMVISLKK